MYSFRENHENEDIRKLLFAAYQHETSNYQKTIENGVEICVIYKIGWSAVHAAVQEHNADAMTFFMLDHQAALDPGMLDSNEDVMPQHCIRVYTYTSVTEAQTIEVIHLLLHLGVDSKEERKRNSFSSNSSLAVDYYLHKTEKFNQHSRNKQKRTKSEHT